MISMALLCDAVIGNVQEKSMKTYNASNTEVVLYSYAIGFCYIFVVMLCSGDLLTGITYFAHVILPIFALHKINLICFRIPRKHMVMH